MIREYADSSGAIIFKKDKDSLRYEELLKIVKDLEKEVKSLKKTVNQLKKESK